MTTQPPKKLSGEQIKRRSREEEKSDPCYLSNDAYLWTKLNPDVKLIEPRILVSVNYNYLEFSRKNTRPPESRSICLVNHGDHPIAFKIQTTDNWSYFVDRKNGVIPPRQTIVNAVVRMPNTVEIQVYRRPHSEYDENDKSNTLNNPHKDKLTVLLAPQMCQTFSPEAIFHNERCHEKLRVMLRYSGIEDKSGDANKRKTQLLLHAVPGWATWKEEDGMRTKKNLRQIEEFRKHEKTIIQNASRELCEEQQQQLVPKAISRGKSRGNTPVFVGRRRPMIRNFIRNRSPFDKTPTTKTTQSITPEKKKSADDDKPPPVLPAVLKMVEKVPKVPPTPKKLSLENPKKLSNEPPSPGITPPKKKSAEPVQERHLSPKEKSRKKSQEKSKSKENEIPPSPNFLKNTKVAPKKDAPSPKPLSQEKLDKKLQQDAQSLQPHTAKPKKGSGEHDVQTKDPIANSPN